MKSKILDEDTMVYVKIAVRKSKEYETYIFIGVQRKKTLLDVFILKNN